MVNEEVEQKSVFGRLVSIFLWIVLLAVLVIAAYLLYQNYPRAAEILQIKAGELGITAPPINASSELRQFVPNMRFNHNALTYSVESNCDAEKTQRFQQALQIIQDQVGIITFSQTSDTEKSDIGLSCSKDSLQTEKNVFVAGEGGPSKYLNSSWYPVILKGNVILYEKSSCDYPITELHELFHVFGFDHINNKNLIMYPYVDCKQTINPQLIETMKTIYSQEPLPELYFTNITVIKIGIYLNFTAEIKNDGLIDAESVSLDVREKGGNLIDSFDLGKIPIGSMQKFEVSNMGLPSLSTKDLEFFIKTSQREFTKDNNKIEVGI